MKCFSQRKIKYLKLLFYFESLRRTSSKRRHPNVQLGGVPPCLPCTTIFLSDWTSSSCPSSTLYSMIHERRNEKLKCPKIWHIFKTPTTLKKNLKNIICTVVFQETFQESYLDILIPKSEEAAVQCISPFLQCIIDVANQYILVSNLKGKREEFISKGSLSHCLSTIYQSGSSFVC